MNKTSIKTVTTENEIITVEKLAKEIWNQHYPPIIGQAQVDYMLMKFQSMNAIKENIDNGYTYYIAYQNDIPCGYSAVNMDNGVFLSKFYVRQSFRGKGVGSSMLDAVITYAKSQDAKRIWLTCDKNNAKSLSVYQKLGFAVIDYVNIDIGNGFNMTDYVLEKSLGSKKQQ